MDSFICILCGNKFKAKEIDIGWYIQHNCNGNDLDGDFQYEHRFVSTVYFISKKAALKSIPKQFLKQTY